MDGHVEWYPKLPKKEGLTRCRKLRNPYPDSLNRTEPISMPNSESSLLIRGSLIFLVFYAKVLFCILLHLLILTGSLTLSSVDNCWAPDGTSLYLTYPGESDLRRTNYNDQFKSYHCWKET